MTRSLVRFPWFGVMAGAGFISLLLALADHDLARHLDGSLIAWFAESGNRLLVFSLVVLLLVFDFVRFRKTGRDQDARIEALSAQVNELFKSRNALQNKVQKYSGHADKLKLFISDRLLEYIEYDEKFLHFKSIASEVRHNGVICYDRVLSLLTQALEQQSVPEGRSTYQEALDSMRYLWDLLDLSTTDNIALYVANRLYEYEELYYQRVLDGNREAKPSSPLFPVRRAAVRALHGFVEQREQLGLERLHKGRAFCYEDSRFWVQLDDAGDLLGNENHLLLIVENMINNGLHYAEQKKYRNATARLALCLGKENGDAVLRIYNPGPEIGEELRDKIYQLGYSTKRSKGHQGKGLGLYFVKQLVSGYEGRIDFHNIRNEQRTYVLRIEGESGAVVNRIVETAVNDKGKLVCRNEGRESDKSLAFSLAQRIRTLEVSCQGETQTHVFRDFEASGRIQLQDPDHPARPAWAVEVREKLSSSEVVFRPLDTTGVEFTICIPTAESRLDPDYHAALQQPLPEPDTLNEQVKAVSRLIDE